MNKIFKYVFIDILRNKIVLAYTAFLLLLSLSIFSLEDSSAKAVLSLLNIVLIIIPMVCVLFAAIYVYNSAEFLELLVSQPLKRHTIWNSLIAGLSFSLILSFVAGIAIPLLIYEPSSTAIMLVVSGIMLTIIFIGLGVLAAISIRDKARGIGAVILLWLFFAILFDGLVLFFLFQFSDYPIEKPMVAITIFNPIDISRILVLLRMNVSAMMGYTGAVFKNYFGTGWGIAASLLILCIWFCLPVWLSARNFRKKDI